MARTSDGKKTLTRERLCALAEVQRAKHRRWINEGLLASRPRYGARDVINAAALDELSQRLPPSLARAAWKDIRGDLGLPGDLVEVVVTPATLDAVLVTSATEFSDALPRNEPVIVVPLDSRIARARERLSAYRGKTKSQATRASAEGGRSAARALRPT